MEKGIYQHIVSVVCGLVTDGSGRLLAAQRSERMPLPLKWEFPGGKVSDNEVPQDALVRELREELTISVRPSVRLPAFDYAEETRVIRLLPFVCQLPAGEVIRLTEHAQYRWVEKNELMTLDWAAADIPLAEYVQSEWETLFFAPPADQKDAQQHQRSAGKLVP